MLEFVSWLRFRVLEPLEVDLDLSAPKAPIAPAAAPSPAPAAGPVAAPPVTPFVDPAVAPAAPTLLQDLQPSPLGPQPDFARWGPAPSALASLPPAAVTPPALPLPEPPSPPPAAAAPELATAPASVIAPATSPEPMVSAAVAPSDPPTAASDAVQDATPVAAPVIAPTASARTNAQTSVAVSSPAPAPSASELPTHAGRDDSPAPTPSADIAAKPQDPQEPAHRSDNDTSSQLPTPASPTSVSPVMMASAAAVIERWILYVEYSVNWRADTPGFPRVKFDFNSRTFNDWYNSQSYLANLVFESLALNNAALKLKELTRPELSAAGGPSTRTA